MLDLQAVLGAEVVHALEPGLAHQVRLQPVEQLYVPAVVAQRLAGHRMARLAGGLQHQLHVHEDAVAVGAAGELARFLPEGGLVHAQRGDEAHLLHVAAGERAVEVVDQGGLHGFQGPGFRGLGEIRRICPKT